MLYAELIQERPALSIDIHTTRHLGGPPAKEADEFERLGLAWMTALARVEVGAMLATFGNVRDPFGQAPPSRFDIDQYRTLILDGARYHYHSIRSDGHLEIAMKNDPVLNLVPMLSAIRRLVLARSMLHSANAVWSGLLTPTQQAELNVALKELDGAQAKLVVGLRMAMHPRRGPKLQLNSSIRRVGTCEDLLRSESRLLADAEAARKQ